MNGTTATAPVRSGRAFTLVHILCIALCIGSLAGATIKRNEIFTDPVSLWRSVAEGTPEKRRSHHNYAVTLLDAGREKGDARLFWLALAELQAALSLPDDGSVKPSLVYRAIGLTYYHLNLFPEAIATWKEGLAQIPGDADLEGDIAFALVQLGRFDEALGHALAARAADPTLPEVVNSLGLIYLEKGNYREAAEHFLEFQKLRPEEPMGYWNAARAFHKAGNFARAGEFAHIYLDREPDPDRRAVARSFIEDLRGKVPAFSN